MSREMAFTTVPWLRRLPVDWAVAPAKSLFVERKQSNLPQDVHLTPSQAHGVVTQVRYMEITGGRVVLNFFGQDSMKHVEPDDFIIHLRSFQGGLERSTLSGKVSSAYTVLSPRAACVPSFFRWALKSSGYVQELRTTTNQLRDGQSIKFADFAKVPLPLPPTREQQEIATFLNRETARIDDLIGKQEQLQKVLGERRVAIVAEVSARGLNRAATLRDSGLGWVGLAPAHWQVVPHRHVLTMRKTEVGSKWEQFDLLSLTKRGVIRRDTTSGEGKFPTSFETYQAVEPDDLVFCLFDIDETPRTVGRVREHGMLTSAYTRFVVNPERADAQFLEWYFSAIDDGKRFRPLYTGLRKVVQKPRFLSAGMVLPPLQEQREIVAYLTEKTSQIDALIAKSEQFVALAKERRAALITAAVTGQIDVREAS